MIRLPIRQPRRQIAIDLGSRRAKVLIVGDAGHGVQILHHQVVDLREEGLLAEEEIARHLAGLLEENGDYPVALVLPQHLAISQVIDLPPVARHEIERLLREETVKLGGLGQTSVIHDSVPLRPAGRYKNPYWVTIAREEAVLRQVDRLAPLEDRINEITTAANALFAAARARLPDAQQAVLVDLGAQTTVIALIEAGQAMLASSFPIGADSFTEAILKARGGTADEAEHLKETTDLFEGDHALDALHPAVDTWLHELAKILKESFENLPAPHPALASVPILLSGGGAAQPGLIRYLRSRAGLNFQSWPKPPQGPEGFNWEAFVLAYGVGFDALQKGAQLISLLPVRLRQSQQRLQQMLLANTFGIVAVGLLALALLVGTWQSLRLIQKKRDLIAQLTNSVSKAQSLERLARRRDRETDRLWPVLQRQERTLAALHTVGALQNARGQKDFWFALVADTESYLAGATIPPAPTNRVADDLTNQFSGLLPANALVAELCIPGNEDQTLKTLGDLVSTLKRDPAYRNVDSLPAQLRRSWVDPRLLVPDRSYALLLEVATPPSHAVLWHPLRDDRSSTNGAPRFLPPPKSRSDRAAPTLPRTKDPA